jgi:hypothetical protein
LLFDVALQAKPAYWSVIGMAALAVGFGLGVAHPHRDAFADTVTHRP